MTRNRYMEIKKYIHFSDNSELLSIPSEERDKLFKIRPLLEKLNQNFLKFGVFSKFLSIDEQMVRYFGHHYLKQFIRAKPIRFGFKQWAICCSETGYCYRMDVYEGKSTTNTKETGVTGLGASVVAKMVSILDQPEQHEIFFDSFFTGFSLMKYLNDINVRATGTCRFDRMNKCPLTKDKEMKKKSRGTYDYQFDTKNEILAITWMDNSCVKLLSNHETIEPLSWAKRWSRSEKKEITISQPKLINQYNKYMGGVDKMDWNVQKYRIKIRGKKWYFPLVTNAIDVALVNSYVLYCMANDQISLLDYRRTVARAYLTLSSDLSDPKQQGRKALPKSSLTRVPVDIRLSGNHVIERTEMGRQRKCAICKANARKECKKCNVGLHMECFIKWHKK